MTQIVSLLAGKNKNFDHQITSLHKALINPGVIWGLEVTAGQVAPGEAFIECTRSNGEKIMVHYQNTSVLNLDTSGNGKIFIEITQENIDNGVLNAEDGSNIGTIKKASAYPNKNYIPLASIAGGTITDERAILTMKNIARKGYASDGILSVENGTEKVLNNLPQGMVDGIKTPILTEVEQKLDAEKVYVEGVVRETISDVLTPVCFVEGGEYTKKFFQPNHYTSQLYEEFPFEVTITGIHIDMKVDFHSTKAFTIIPYNSTGQALQTQNIEFNYNAREKTGLNIRTSKLDVRMSQGFNNQNTFYITVKFRLERGFYKFQHNQTRGRLVGFLKNKSIGENVKMVDIATIKHIPLDVANGSYLINENGLVTLWNNFTDGYLFNTNETQYPKQLRIGRVHNGKLAVNLQNVGYFSEPTFIFSGMRRFNHNGTLKYHLITHQYSDTLQFFI